MQMAMERTSHAKKCCVCQCGDSKIKKHRFPHPDKKTHLFENWMKNVNVPLFKNKSRTQIYYNYVICDRHFQPHCKVVSKRGLTVEACPTLHLPIQSESQNSHSSPLEPIQVSSCPPAYHKNYSSQTITQCRKMSLPLYDVIKLLKAINPLSFAEPWDNVGLLVEPSTGAVVNTVLLTIDLTEDVVDEAIENKSRLIISYHPNIFKPLKCVSQRHWKERIITKCIKNDIAVFSPHTSWDTMANGLNDWLARAFDVESSKPITEHKDNPLIGSGRYITLNTAISLKAAVNLVKKHIGIPYLRVGIGRHRNLDSPITNVAICAGAGTSVLNAVVADLYLTGEMLHHDVLEATQQGINVILCNHSDSERGFLQYFKDEFGLKGLNVIVSKVDKDCLEIM